jgi:signal peptidase II
MKFRSVLIIVFLILLADQALKFYIKTHFSLGESVSMFGNAKWAQLNFIENRGMAFGIELGGDWGKLALTLFRLVACIWGFFFVNGLIKQQYHKGLIFCASLILAGAIGNLIDSIFYGMIFTEGNYHLGTPAKLVAWGQGYGKLLHGRVVDMLYFPVYKSTWPSWVPVWGGSELEFFRPIFNIADAAISTGVISILVFQKSLLHNKLAIDDSTSKQNNDDLQEIEAENN